MDFFYFCTRMMKKLLIFVLLCLVGWHQMQAVDVFSRKLNTASGLPNNNVRSLLQDAHGYIWMGTPDGLYRYDGYFFTTYKYTPEGNNRLLNNNHITGLYAIDSHRLLITEQGNLSSVYDIEKRAFVNVSDSEKQQFYAQCREKRIDEQAISPYRSMIANDGGVINDNLGNTVVIDNKGHIWHIDRKTRQTIMMTVYDEALFPLVSSKKYKVMTSEKNGLIWVSTNGCGITVYDRHSGTEQHIRQSSGLISTDYIVDMCMDSDDNVWVADEFHGVVYLTTASQQAEALMLDAQARGLRSNQVYIMRCMADSTMLIANTEGDVYKTDRLMQLPDHPTWSGLDIHSVCDDKAGHVWIGSRQQGLLAGDQCWYRHDAADASSVSANNIYSLLCDSEGRVWVASEDSYLDLAVRQQDGSYTFRHFFDSHFAARVMMQDSNGIIWVGTRNGLYSFRPDALIHDSRAYSQLLSAVDLNNAEVTCLYEDSHGIIWVGTMGSGVFCNDGKGGSFVRKESVRMICNDVQSILEDGKGRMWLATTDGLTCYDPKSGLTMQHYNENNLLHNYYAANCAALLSDGRVAFGTNAGILVYDAQTVSKTPMPSRLRITDVLAGGLSKGVASEVRLAYNENSPTIRFSAFNYRSLAGMRYTYYLEGFDNQWSEPGSYSFASYRNLPPGTYQLHVKAYGLDQQSDDEVMMTIVVQHPWWQTWWAWLLYIIAATLIGLFVYRQLRTVYRLRQRIAVERQLTEYKLQFFTNISHEFRTPLTIIRGAMDRIRRMGELPAEMRQPVSSMNRSVSRMLRLINQLLEFRKMQNDKLRLALEETEVVGFVNEIFQSFWDIAENKHINYVFTSQERSHTMFVDRSHLDKIVFNILSNAFKYTPSHGDVTLRVGFSSTAMILSVADTGVGIPKEKQQQLFSRFMQSSFSNDSIGIGLHLTKALVEVHHGTIRYAPNQPKGSVFTVEIPLDKSIYAPDDFLVEGHQLLEQVTDTDNSVYRELASAPLNDRRVLIVDDDSDVMDYLVNLLQRYFVIQKASDGIEATHILEQQVPDLVISDVMMPVMDGLELTAYIRRTETIKDVPVILLTALTTDDKRIKAMKRGADAYITKPFDAQLLIATAVRLIQQRDTQKSQYMQQTAESKTVLPEIIVDERDKRFLELLDRWLSSHLNDATLSVDSVAEAMGYRRTVFFKKIKALTGQTPADYIKSLRLNRAAELLRQDTITVSEVCYQVGISDPHYFAKLFKQQFGISPKKYQQGGSR